MQQDLKYTPSLLVVAKILEAYNQLEKIKYFNNLGFKKECIERNIEILEKMFIELLDTHVEKADMKLVKLLLNELKDTRVEMIQFHQIHQDLTSTQNNINTNKEIEVKSEMKLDTLDNINDKENNTLETETITPSVKQWGGSRSGSGRKSGPQGPKSQATKDKMRLAKIGNKNAVKPK